MSGRDHTAAAAAYSSAKLSLMQFAGPAVRRGGYPHAMSAARIALRAGRTTACGAAERGDRELRVVRRRRGGPGPGEREEHESWRRSGNDAHTAKRRASMPSHARQLTIEAS